MALLLDRRMLGRADGFIDRALSEKMAAVDALQRHPNSGEFNVPMLRAWLEEYGPSTALGHEIDLPTATRNFETPNGFVATRVYNPAETSMTFVFLHGGGWCFGSVDTHDHMARWLASQTGGRVVSVDYDLAPEHPYPAAMRQASAVISAVLRESPRNQVFVVGDSSGANIAATAILDLPSRMRGRLAGFISLYGAYAPEMNLSSHRLYGDGRFGLSEAQMRWFWNLYAPHLPPERRAELLSPIGADLADFPPTLCVGAECDMLLDDTLAFYGELAKAAVDVTLSLWSGLPHGCMLFVGVVDSVTEAAGAIMQFVETHQQRRSRLEIVKPIATRVAPASQPPETIIDVEPLFTGGRSRLHGSLAHRIASDIIKGVLVPGALLPNEDKASASFGVSRSAYREAIRTLAAKGLVLALPKVGTKIAPRASWRIVDPDVLTWHFELEPTDEFVHNLFELRKIIEPSAAALAATRRGEEDLSRLADSLTRMSRMNPRTGGWLNAIIAFHEEIFSAAGNEAIASLWPAVQTTLRWSVKLQMMLPTLSLAHDPVADHARVFEKISSEDAEAALQEMALLIDSALQDTLINSRRVKAARGLTIT